MPLKINSPTFSVTITPERGGDIVQIVDLESDVPLLSVSPTASVTSPASVANDSMTRWLTGYPGGWQFLTPNAGPDRDHDGVRQGYHGESALSVWTVQDSSPSSAVLSARLVTAPLELTRYIEVTEEIAVTDTVRNLSPDPVSVRMVQHPAFGSPFLDKRSYLMTDAGTMISDAEAPGNMVAANVHGAPSDLLPAGPTPASFQLPGVGARRSLFAALTDFPDEQPSVFFASPTRGFGVEMSWRRSSYPMAWLWVEANGIQGWPWFRRMFAVAVEPANVLPGEGVATNGMPRGGNGTTIDGGDAHISTVRLRRRPLTRA
ncbi:MAG: DUF4432 family protein [Microbacteriaceae bacterium]|nr:MAG: DUF4432 family protein [Microbacteriaceae bacterium]